MALVSQQALDRGLRGRITFIGSGPGLPSLLTLAAVDAVNEADGVVLLTDEQRVLLSHAGVTPREVTVLDEDDAPDFESLVREGRSLAVLIPGDPFLNAETAMTVTQCIDAGLDVEVIPGVPRRVALPEFAGVSLSAQVQMITLSDPVDAEQHWAPVGPLVVMGAAGQIGEVSRIAQQSGRAADEAALVVVSAGSVNQASQHTTVEELGAAVASLGAEERTTVMVVIGDQAGPEARRKLNWFENKPLFGWRVLVPRTMDQAGALLRRLESYGAITELVPTISVEPPRQPQLMERAIHGLVEGRYEWIAFTSANAVRAVREKFDEYGLDARSFSGLKLAAVGEATQAALQAWGLKPDLVPEGEQSVAGLAAEFPAYDDLLDPINRVLLPRADIATEPLSHGLVELGWEVEDVIAFRTVRAAPPPVEIRDAIKTGQFDAVVFTSSSTVRNLVGIAGKPHNAMVIAAIGPRTAETCVEHGLRVDVQPDQPSPIEMVDALAHFAEARREQLKEKGKPVVRPSLVKRRGRPSSRAVSRP
ncbi:uroporphyrinogen-III synthase [Aestuariimicrobium ganziense]|uniref:uroporphyrinogen-III synthase n=1 Tax=Aestuariimicrobium ganziense TaxID=2773677 RepID=UPI0019424C63|nr:uroporphyrinogen-III synthase [Aestuariimicrobium ganziense]